MISSTILIISLAFYLLYNTSAKSVKNTGLGIENLIIQNPVPAKLTGLILLIIAAVTDIIIFGFGSGSLTFFIILMTAGSLLILLTPLKLVTLRTLSVFFVCSLTIELFIQFT
ncbi:hypothetical protein [Robertkochia solimangrovi]|uniref:hypothetical protein n=1 Tax=Robertkochia solimangrovi TaxID=2213046 RepID=UPI00117FF75A|nr:hypothetical protein [Robertkochia solimangrovi]TRZ41945.1 hypothetical protein DMZ48_15005 [Robertkochia solimangrovi]